MHIIAVQKHIIDENPWVARNLINAFQESKRRSLERLFDPAVSRYPLAWLPTYARKMRDMFGADPFPYGIEENRADVGADAALHLPAGHRAQAHEARRDLPRGRDDQGHRLIVCGLRTKRKARREPRFFVADQAAASRLSGAA